MTQRPSVRPARGEFDRRVFLQRAALFGTGVFAAGVLASCRPAGGSSASPSAAGAVGPALPADVPADLALQTLLEGNRRYREERSIHPNLSAERRAEVAERQEPWSTVLGCSDSRVPPEIIFDVGPGDMFVSRVAGNVAAEAVLESLEYSVGHLGVGFILVLGHSSCGAVHAVLTGEGDSIPEIAHLIEPAVEGLEDDEHAAVVANALAQREHVIRFAPIAEAIEAGEVEVAAGVFDLQTGAVEILEVPVAAST